MTAPIVVDRRRSPYSTSFPIDDVTVALPEGGTRRLVFKDLRPSAMLPEARGNRPSFLWDAFREVAMYREVLAGAGLGTAVCHEATFDPETGDASLLLEKVDGVELWQIGDKTVWRNVAAWLARMHERLRPWTATGAVPLIRYDRAHYEGWQDRASRFARDGGVRLGEVLDRYPLVVDALLDLPPTLIHGEFFPSNVLIGPGRVCPVDWEMAAVGPALVDLAALASGWDDGERIALAAAYATAAELDRAAVLRGLDLCLVYVSVRTLGWAERWRPPPEHVQDWVGLAAAALERLALA